MADDAAIDALVEAVIEAGVAVKALQSPAVEAAYRTLLFELGRELARREQGAPDDDP